MMYSVDITISSSAHTVKQLDITVHANCAVNMYSYNIPNVGFSCFWQCIDSSETAIVNKSKLA